MTRRKQPEMRIKPMTDRRCDVCDTVGPDRRTLKIDMLWQMNEVSALFQLNKETRLYEMTICKGCRAVLLHLISVWINGHGRKIDPHIDDAGIAVYTIDGAAGVGEVLGE